MGLPARHAALTQHDVRRELGLALKLPERVEDVALRGPLNSQP